MAGLTISQLPALPSPLGTDIFPVTQGGTTYKETMIQLEGLLNAVLTFLPIAGGTMTGAINMGAHQINNMSDPTLSQDAATKAYVDFVAQGLNVLPAVYAATTAPLTVTYNNGAAGVGATLTNAGAQATFALDSVNPPLNSRVLIKNQSSALQNGIYTVTNVGSGATNWVLTRATDYNTPSDINPGDFVLVDNGTTNSSTGWVETATVTAIGTDAINFSLLGSTNFAAKGANADITSMSGLTGYLQAPLGIKDSNGNIVTKYGSVASAVNYIQETNSATGTGPSIAALGSDTNITLDVKGKGTGGVNLFGTSTNNNAPAGVAGEFISSVVSSGSAISLSNGVNANVTSISLSGGDWDVWGNVFLTALGGGTSCGGWVSSVSATTPDISLYNGLTASFTQFGFSVPMLRFSLASTTTIYLTTDCMFAGSATACGAIYARRIR